jgi:hypothetical protein
VRQVHGSKRNTEQQGAIGGSGGVIVGHCGLDAFA